MSTTTNVIDRIVEQNLAVYRASPSRLQEDVSQEAQVASDYRGRLVYELLQNADDAMADAHGSSDRVAFLVTDDELWIANDGRALTDDDVQGLCGLGASSKVDTTGKRRASIGHKGLGFKSVLEVTDEPTVYSLTYAFTLGQRHALPVVTELWESQGRTAPRSVPAMRFPVSVPDDDPRWSDYASDGFNTAFRFPFRDSLPAHARRTVAELLLTLPLTTVLFLKHLERVDVTVEQEGRVETRAWELNRDVADGEDWRPTSGLSGSGLYRVTITTDDETASFAVAHDADVVIGRHRVGLSGPAWEGVELTEVSVATPLDRREDVPEAWRRFHVFLPTAEPCPYPFLVNAAFSTDLSRQQVRVASDPLDYNAHLVRQAARLVRERVLPVLSRESPEAVLAALDRAGDVPTVESSAAELLHRALVDELKDVPLLPAESGTALTLAQALLPPSVLDEAGQDYRSVLPHEASWEGRSFPSARFCAGRWARIAADHGARELSAAESLTVLAAAHDPARATTVDDASGGFELDPLLELCSALWHRTSGFERTELEAQARMESLFPVRRNEDRTLERVVLADDIAFYPPRSARQDLPLRGLRFMSHAVCWGALNQNERLTLLADRMKAWTSLFDVREFRFETVVQAAITPALRLHPDAAALELREELENEQALAAVCQLAGRATKPDRPLRYQRLQSDRALFNLSRLPVPCRSANGEPVWLPAYRVYFGEDWIGPASVECIARAVPAEDSARQELDFAYLAPPDTLLHLLDDRDTSPDSSMSDDDEVDENEDVDEAIEADAKDRWIAFLAWLGVNKALRPIHFHDVDDDATGWLSTKNLARPRGWAFEPLGEPWRVFERAVRQLLDDRSLLDGVVPYFYEVHDLDQIGTLIPAIERDATNGVAVAFFAHLARHWSTYQAFSTCQVALVEEGKSPGQRNKPQRALPEELETAGDNLWLYRLRRRGICPTSHGPRQPSTTWQPSAELERRFRRRNRSAGDLLPVLQLPDGVSAQSAHSLAERLGVRAEPSPSTFRVDDARMLCERLEALTTHEGAPPLASQLREIKPVYRQLFELLSGRSSAPAATGELRDAPLLADAPDGFAYLRAADVLYASTPGIRERSGVAGRVATFVLEAEPAARAPLTGLFGLRTLEAALEWSPDPGESPLTEEELAAVREGLSELIGPLLARIRVERTDAADVRLLREFVRRVEPVDDLMLTCTLDGAELKDVRTRPYFVEAPRGEPLRAFVVWGDGEAWPPSPDTAQGLAMALADALGLNLVETFLAFIQSDDAQRRRLLDIAGGTGFLEEVREDLADPESDHEETANSVQESEPTPAPGASEHEGEAPIPPSGATKPAPARVPLFDFEQLTIGGDPILVFGERPEEQSTESSSTGSSTNGSSAGRRAAAGTDLGSLDALGMRIALAYEVHRLRRAGHRGVEVLGPETSSEKETLVVDVHTPTAIAAAESRSPTVRRVVAELVREGISAVYPGFDILVILDGALGRAIELKSSGVDARVQAMSWNEWKTAGSSHTRERFWLYLVGNLRSDLGHPPFVRCIRDPFGSLAGDEVTSERRERAVQLRVREFAEAEYLELGLRR